MSSGRIFGNESKGTGGSSTGVSPQKRTKDFESKILDAIKRTPFNGTAAEKEKIMVRIAGKVSQLSIMREKDMELEGTTRGVEYEGHYSRLLFNTMVLEHSRAEYDLNSALNLLDKGLNLLKSDSEASKKKIELYNKDFKRFYMEEEAASKA
ncbi:MAG: hypothetical protein WC506_06760 [Candidatus Micrarchaeia archaeon]